MKQEQRTILRFLRDENGATSIEYAIIAAGVASAIVAAVTALGTSVNSTWQSVSSALQ